MLNFKLDGQTLIYLDEGDVIVGGTVAYLEAKFDFSEEWKGYSEIMAFFKNGAAIYLMDVTDGKIKERDNLNLEAGTWSVYLKATNYEDGGEIIAKQITSSTVKLNVLHHGKFDGTEFPKAPSSIWEQKYNEISDAERIRTEAEDKRYQAEEHRAKAESDRIGAEMERDNTEQL